CRIVGNRRPRSARGRGPGDSFDRADGIRPGPPGVSTCTRVSSNRSTNMQFDRRELMKLLGLGGVVLGSGLPGFSLAASKGKPAEDFMFLQLSDAHWGFSGPPNPEADKTLKEAVQAANASKLKPDFIGFTAHRTPTTP